MKRFNVKHALLATAFVALIVGVVVLQLQNLALRREARLLRQEVGYLVPLDLRKINIVEVPTLDPYTWRWRVYAPPGTKFDACILAGELPGADVPPNYSFQELEIASEPQGVLVTALVSKDIDSGYQLRLEFGKHVCGTVVNQERDDFIDGSAAIQSAGRLGTEAFEFEEPIVLLEKKLSKPMPMAGKTVIDAAERGVRFYIKAQNARTD